MWLTLIQLKTKTKKSQEHFINSNTLSHLSEYVHSYNRVGHNKTKKKKTIIKLNKTKVKIKNTASKKKNI